MSTSELKRRLVALERKVNSLERMIITQANKHPNSWIDSIHGTFANNAEYRKAARFGRIWRRSQITR